MAIRMTGMISGMDTESIVKQLIDAQKMKNKRTTDKQTLLTWKQDKWKELNAKLFKLYTEDVSKLRLQGNYQAKKVTSSNESLVTVTGGANAPEGAHNLSISQLASSQYVTSGKLGDSVTTSTRLKDTLIGMESTDGNDPTITIKNGSVEKKLIVTGTTTLGDYINACKDAGLNASYDATQKRIFISSKNSGSDNMFSITSGAISSVATGSLNNIKSLVNYSGMNTTDQSKVTAALSVLEGKTSEVIDALYLKEKSVDAEEQKVIDALATLRNYAIKKAETDVRAGATQQTKDEIKSAILSDYSEPDSDTLTTLEAEIQAEIDAGKLPEDTDKTLAAQERYKQNMAVLDDIKAQVSAKIESGQLAKPDGKTKEEFIDETAQSTYDAAVQDDRNKMFENIVGNKLKTTEYQTRLEEVYNSNIEAYKADALTGTSGLVAKLKEYNSNSSISPDGYNNLSKLGLGEIDGTAITGGTNADMVVVAASDAKIKLDGAELTSSTNVITANGLTITVKGKTTDGENISLNVVNNTQDTYDMIKNFVKNYNEILKEMNKLFGAPSSRGFDPLSDEERESMTDDQIEKWETKIKDSVLRRDNTLGSLNNAMRTSLMTSVEVDGKRYSLSSFGIVTSADYTEKGLLHIQGNKDDAIYAALEDKLMKALEEDPDTVMKVLSGVTTKLYNSMQEKMSAIPNFRSALTFYNDKEMDKIQTRYKKQVKTLEEKLTDMENKYFKQFAAMETALAKMQKQSNALAGMLGTSYNQ